MKMTKEINTKFLFAILIFISLILVSAFIIEYKLGHKPCKLCLYERVPYIISVLLIITCLSSNISELSLTKIINGIKKKNFTSEEVAASFINNCIKFFVIWLKIYGHSKKF